MAIFRIEKRKENDCVKLCELLNYVRNPLATSPDLTYGSYISCRYPYEEMMIIKSCYTSPFTRTWQGRQFFDFIVSLTEEESVYLERFSSCMITINQFIATLQGGHYQTIHSIHLNTDNLHAHVVMNNIDVYNGKRFNLNKHAFSDLCTGVDVILQNNGFMGIEKGKVPHC